MESWIDNKAKSIRARGLEGEGRKGFIKAREIKKGCSKDCRLICTEKITDEERLAAFTEFHDLADKLKQWLCLNNWISIMEQKERTQKET